MKDFSKKKCKWASLRKTDDYSIYFSDSGSILDSTTSWYKIKLHFSSLYSFEMICELLTSPQEKKKWDKTVESWTSLENISNNIQLLHTTYSAAFIIGEREFIDKRFIIPWNDENCKKLIIYSTSLPEQFWPTDKNIIRGERIFK